MLNESCNEFIQKLSTKAPVPGGGGVCAYVGALGMALGSMVGNLTVGKKKYINVEEDIKILLDKSEEITLQLKRLVEKDAEVFLPLSKAYGLPTSTDEEKAYKEKALQEVLVDATLVPLEIARWSYEALKLHHEYAEKGSIIAISDVGVGVILCQSAIRGAKLNVLINTKILKDKEFKKKVEDEINAIEKKALIEGEAIFKDVESQLAS